MWHVACGMCAPGSCTMPALCAGAVRCVRGQQGLRRCRHEPKCTKRMASTSYTLHQHRRRQGAKACKMLATKHPLPTCTAHSMTQHIACRCHCSLPPPLPLTEAPAGINQSERSVRIGWLTHCIPYTNTETPAGESPQNAGGQDAPSYGALPGRHCACCAQQPRSAHRR